MVPKPPAGPAAETKREQYEARRVALESDRSTWIEHWRDLSSYVVPNRFRQNSSDTNRGTKNQQKIIDGTATMAARTLASGMMSGVTSPSRPWFMLSLPDPDLADYDPVKEWLATETRGMLETFNKSNIYNTLHRIFADIGVFGTAGAGILEDDRDVIRGYDFPIGSFVLGANDRLEVDTFIRGPFPMTVRNVVRRFGIDSVCKDTRELFNSGKYEKTVQVIQNITTNPDFDAGKIHSRFKKWMSCYYEVAANKNESLGEAGFDEFPVLAPRWETTGEDVWGRGPGMDALPDVKALQMYERRTATAVEKTVNPPLTGPTSLRTVKVSQLPGDITYADMQNGQPALRPLHEVRFDINAAEAKSQQIRERIKRTFFADLFLMLANDTREQPATAREIAERHEEKLLALGPVLERLNGELLKPLIDRTFAIRMRRGLVSKPPEELRGMDLRVEYISIMAQAQKMVGLAGIERTTGFVLQIAAVQPDALDKVDFDQLISEYGENAGLSPKAIRPDDAVAQIRQQRQESQAKQQQAEQGVQMAKSAKDLASADTNGQNALTDMIQTATGA